MECLGRSEFDLDAIFIFYIFGGRKELKMRY
jgi:hypothetical protein